MIVAQALFGRHTVLALLSALILLKLPLAGVRMPPIVAGGNGRWLLAALTSRCPVSYDLEQPDVFRVNKGTRGEGFVSLVDAAPSARANSVL